MHVHIQTSKKQMQRKSLMKPDGRKKHLTYVGTRIRIILDFLSEAIQVQR